RAPVAAEELLALQGMEPLVDLCVYTAERRDRGRPEDLAVHSRVLEKLFLFGRERVEAGADDSLHRLRKRQILVGAALAEHLRVLLRVERVATDALEQLRLLPGLEQGAAQHGAEQPRGVLGGEHRERERRRVRLPAAPAGPP